ncbi:MAG: hypothetical protein AB7V16_06955 [Vulcanibacillus sp.]
MIYILYGFNTIQLLLVSIYLVVHYIKQKRRISDIFLSISAFIYSLNFGLYIIHLTKNPIIIEKLILDIVLAITIAVCFLASLMNENNIHIKNLFKGLHHE